MKLKPCPFCGKEMYLEKVWWDKETYVYVFHHKEHIEGWCFIDSISLGNNKKDSIKIWNTRVMEER